MIDVTGVANDSTQVALFIWNSPDSEPLTPTITLAKPVPSSEVLTVWYDISPYLREYIAMQSFTEVTTPTAAPVAEYCYVHVVRYLNGVSLVKEYNLLCMDGYGYQAEGIRPDDDVMLAEGDYYVETGSTSGALGIFQDLSDTWEVKYTGLTSGGTTTLTISNEISYTPYLLPAYVNEGNKVEILVNSAITYTYNFRLQDECKYTPINCDFVNKQGVWQRLVFFKKSSSSLVMKNEEFDLMPSSPNYNVLDNVRSTFNTNAMETITCNTGWVFEAYSDVMRQLQLSEKILLDDVPVLVSSKAVNLQKNINDKTINYEVTFRYSAPTLQYNI
jgi:hypothetical protein